MFLEFDLEGKVIAEGGVIVTEPNPQTLGPDPTTSERNPVTTDTTLVDELQVSPTKEHAGPREKRSRRAPAWVKDYYTT